MQSHFIGSYLSPFSFSSHKTIHLNCFTHLTTASASHFCFLSTYKVIFMLKKQQSLLDFITHTHTHCDFEPPCCSAHAQHPLKTGYITINLSVCALRSIAFGIVDTQQGNFISPACLWGEKENYLLFIINSTKAKDKE